MLIYEWLSVWRRQRTGTNKTQTLALLDTTNVCKTPFLNLIYRQTQNLTSQCSAVFFVLPEPRSSFQIVMVTIASQWKSRVKKKKNTSRVDVKRNRIRILIQKDVQWTWQDFLSKRTTDIYNQILSLSKSFAGRN